MTRAPTSPFDKELFVAVLENVNLSGMNEAVCTEIVSTATETQPTRTSISSKTISNLWIAFDTRRQRDAALLVNWADHFTPQCGSHIFSREGRRHSPTHDSQTPQLLEIVRLLSSQVSQLTEKVESLTEQVATLSSTPASPPFTNYNYGPQTHNYFCSHPVGPPPGLEKRRVHSETPTAQPATTPLTQTIGKLTVFSPTNSDRTSPAKHRITPSSDPVRATPTDHHTQSRIAPFSALTELSPTLSSSAATNELETPPDTAATHHVPQTKPSATSLSAAWTNRIKNTPCRVTAPPDPYSPFYEAKLRAYEDSLAPQKLLPHLNDVDSRSSGVG